MSPSKKPSAVPSTVPSIMPSIMPSSSKLGIAVCGATDQVRKDGGCHTKQEAIDSSTLRHVRCCSDTDLGEPWVQRGSCSIYGATANIGGTIQISGTMCSGPLNFYDAMAFCDAAGGRLCTADELNDNCTSQSGCNYNHEMIWSSTVPSLSSTGWIVLNRDTPLYVYYALLLLAVSFIHVSQFSLFQTLFYLVQLFGTLNR